MKIAIVGSRGVPPHLESEVEAQIEDVLDGVIGDVTLISGGAKGVDSIARRVARSLWIPYIEFIPDWRTHGKKAGFLRNREIVDTCDVLHAWWDGKSRGTKYSIDLARAAGKPVVVHSIAEVAL